MSQPEAYSLASNNWKLLPLSDSTKKYYFKFISFNNSNFTFIITDLVRVWLSENDKNDIEQSIEQYCPQLSMSIKDLINLIREFLQNPPQSTKFEISIHPIKKVLKLTILA